MNEKISAVDCVKLWEAANKHFPDLQEIYVGISGAFNKLPSDDKFRFKRFDFNISPDEDTDSIGPGGKAGNDGGDVSTDPDAPPGYKDADYDLTSGGSGPVYPVYVAMREELQTIFKNTIKNIGDTATTLNRAAWSYAETDGLSAKDLKNQIEMRSGYRDPKGNVKEGEERPEYHQYDPDA